MAKRGKGIFLVYTDIPAEYEDDFKPTVSPLLTSVS